MAKTGATIRNVLVWTYERGTLQYDIICALILIFIFLVPKSCFTAKRSVAPRAGSNQTVPLERQAAETPKTTKNVK
jgi:hypothetical protein